MRIETLIIVASEVFSSRAKADRGTHLPSRWFFGLSTNKKGAEALLFRVSTPLSIRIGSKSLSGFPLRTKRLSFHISYKYGKIVYHYTQLFQ